MPRLQRPADILASKFCGSPLVVPRVDVMAITRAWILDDDFRIQRPFIATGCSAIKVSFDG